MRFRRWSRASYAVFVSMTCAVTIGVLAVSVSEKSELKATATSNYITNSLFTDQIEDELRSNDELITVVEESVITTIQNDYAAACGHVKYLVN